MKYINLIAAFSMILSLSSCATKQIKSEDDLIKFAKSNCFFWYFKSQGMDTTEIRKVTTGVVEMSTYSADKFQKVALLVKGYSPDISTKNNVNKELSKCFTLGTDKDFISKLHAISEL
jgi:hypothetical protein